MNNENAVAVIGQKPKYVAKANEEVLSSVIDDIEAILVQRTKEAREFTMLVAWETGQAIRKAEREHKVNITSLVIGLANDNRISGRQMGERNLWFSVAFYDKFNKFEDVYETEFGENVSLTKIKKMLVKPKSKKDKTLEEVASSLVDKYGIDGARELAAAITEECDVREKDSDE